MSPQIFSSLYTDARTALASGNIIDALTAIEGMLTAVSDWEDVEKVRDIRDGYHAMLDYLFQGTDDPERDTMRLKFIQRLIVIMERTRRNFELADSPLPVAQAYRSLRATRPSTDMFAEDFTPTDRFNAVWTSRPWTAEDMERMLIHLMPQQEDSEEPALIVSAVMLATLTYFDPYKLQLLLHLCQDPDEQIAERALVGVILCHVTHADLLPHFPDLQQTTYDLLSDDTLRQRLIYLQELLLSAQCTPEVNRKLKENYEELLESAHAEKMENIKDLKAGIKKVFGIFIDIQAHGADMNYDNFKNLYKISNDFFLKAANWFYPFTYDHPDIVNVTIPDALRKLFEMKRHTATDKYAFVLMLRNSKVEINGMQDKDGNPLESEDLPIEEEKEDSLKHYVFDLYRYFTLYHKAKEHKNPFKEDLLLVNHPLFHTAFTDEDAVKTIIQKLLIIRNFTDAIPLLESLSEAHPESVWTLEKLGLCYDELGDYEAAYDYFSAALIYKPDDEKIQHKIISLLIRAKREEEALPLVYKLYFKDAADTYLLRCLAWCTLKANLLDESIGYFTTLTSSSDARPFDYQNFGHARLLNGEISSAISLYLKAAQARDDDEATLSLYDFLFDSDSDWLLTRKGITPSLLHLITDAVSQQLPPHSEVPLREI